MCRWMAWHGHPMLIEDLLFRPKHGLVDQSLHSRMGAETTNGDGFGLGWYGVGDGPGVYRSVKPAWGDDNLRDLAGHVESPLFLSHVRAAIGSPVQETNCHPFRHGRWLFVHNGYIDGMRLLRRNLMLAIAPEQFADVIGSTDSEVLFHIALSHGLEDDVIGALERAIGFVEETGRAHGVEFPFQGSVGVSDGERVWAVRYSSEGRSRSLFASADVHALQLLHPDNENLKLLRDTDRVIVSEPLGDLPGAWHEIAEATAVTVHPGGALEQRPFTPQPLQAPLDGAKV
jgi:predicted glutamine amidotransferase